MTMLNGIYKNDNNFFKLGFNALLESLFPAAMFSSLAVNKIYKGKDTATDIMVLSLCRGEEYICHPELQHRRGGILIGLVGKQFRWRGGILPSCLKEMIFIQQDEKIYRMIAQIKRARMQEATPSMNQSDIRCHDCRHRKLSRQQEKVAAALLAGLSVREIAGKLALSEKTVFSHKRIIMSKFKLRHDVDLVLLLNYLRRSSAGHND